MFAKPEVARRPDRKGRSASDRITHHSVMALALTGGVRMDTVIMHGCAPATSYKTITKAEGNIVLEFDGRPAVEEVARLFGEDRTWEGYPVYITIGINHGDRFDPRDEDYAVRLCMDIDRERGGLVMLGDDMQAGTEVQLMRRTLDLGYVRRRAEELLERVGDRKRCWRSISIASGVRLLTAGPISRRRRGCRR